MPVYHEMPQLSGPPAHKDLLEPHLIPTPHCWQIREEGVVPLVVYPCGDPNRPQFQSPAHMEGPDSTKWITKTPKVKNLGKGMVGMWEEL